MSRYVVRRLAAACLQLLIITFVAYVLFFLIADLTGANPAQRVAGKGATPARVREIAHIMGTDRPWYGQYGHFVWRLAHGDLGYSFQRRQSVTSVVLPAAGVTASLILGAAVLWLLIAIVVGLVGALRPRSLIDRVLTVGVQTAIAAPVFWVAPMLAYLLAYEPTQGRLFGMSLGRRLDWLPIEGYVGPLASPVGWAHHLILPWLTLAIGFAALYARFVRAFVLEQFGEDYVRTARAKGASERRVLRHHIGPLVAPAVVTLLGLDVGVALGGALFVEQVYGLPGLGYVGLSSIQNLDYPLTVGTITFAALVAVAANALADLVQVALDPRVRLT
jgi:peptide/nickel transport system permease protein